MNNKEILMQPYDLRYIRLIRLYFITRSSTYTCMYQRVYTCKHVPLRILVCVPPAPHVLACVCLCVPLHCIGVLPYENYTRSGTCRHTCDSTRSSTYISACSGSLYMHACIHALIHARACKSACKVL